MINAYDKDLLPNAQKSLASLFDYAVDVMNKDINVFWNDFLNSDISRRLMNGDFRIINGKSGIELFYEIYDTDEGGLRDSFNEHKTPEYWLGYYLAYFQWFTSLDLSRLTKYVSIEELLHMYTPYHEMGVDHFVHDVLKIYNERKQYTNLQIYRKEYKMSRRELAEKSHVSQRMIEQYEQRKKSINKANFETVLALAKSLYIKPEDLLEINIESN